MIGQNLHKGVLQDDVFSNAGSPSNGFMYNLTKSLMLCVLVELDRPITQILDREWNGKDENWPGFVRF